MVVSRTWADDVPAFSVCLSVRLHSLVRFSIAAVFLPRRLPKCLLHLKDTTQAAGTYRTHLPSMLRPATRCQARALSTSNHRSAAHQQQHSRHAADVKGLKHDMDTTGSGSTMGWARGMSVVRSWGRANCSFWLACDNQRLAMGKSTMDMDAAERSLFINQHRRRRSRRRWSIVSVDNYKAHAIYDEAFVQPIKVRCSRW
ncbi:hypothetical protein IWX90DRAFT_319784 [Phyllosticta citrichinensis]|uniref:Uncharacterized protein n=1 Tax=Phyllosticta citrichinensis TaxID=1130410 RepID=A0ABR1XJH5_9PEZI